MVSQRRFKGASLQAFRETVEFNRILGRWRLLGCPHGMTGLEPLKKLFWTDYDRAKFLFRAKVGVSMFRLRSYAFHLQLGCTRVISGK